MTRTLAIVIAVLLIACGIEGWVIHLKVDAIATLNTANGAKDTALKTASDVSKTNADTIATLQGKLATAAGTAQDLQARFDDAQHKLDQAKADTRAALNAAAKARGTIYANDPASADYGRAVMPGPLSDSLRQRYETLAAPIQREGD